MQVTGMLYGSKLLQFAGFPDLRGAWPGRQRRSRSRRSSTATAPYSSSRCSRAASARRARPGLLGRAKDLKTALKEKERLYFVEHRHRQSDVQGERRHVRGRRSGRARGLFLDHRLDPLPRADDDAHAPRRHGHRGARQGLVAHVPFDPLTGLKAFVVANALSELNAPKQIISPLVQQLPKLWELFHDFGMTTLELNPIRMRPDRQGRLTPVACDFKCGFDRDDPRWQRLDLPRAPVRRRLFRLRAGDQPAAHATRARATCTSSTRRARSSRRRSAAAPTRW